MRKMTSSKFSYMDAAYIDRTGKSIMDNIFEKDAKIAELTKEIAELKTFIVEETMRSRNLRIMHTFLNDGFTFEEVAKVFKLEVSTVEELTKDKYGLFHIGF